MHGYAPSALYFFHFMLYPYSMKIIRLVLGKLILFFNFIIPPKKIVSRSAQEQEAVNTKLKSLALYQFEACPFCVKVRRFAKSADLTLIYKDAKNDLVARKELEVGGGKIKAPCLKISHADGTKQWMYESNDIINYLKESFV